MEAGLAVEMREAGQAAVAAAVAGAGDAKAAPVGELFDVGTTRARAHARVCICE